MVRDIICHDGKFYQVLTSHQYNEPCFETRIFPVNGESHIPGHEVYSFHTFESGESKNKHRDIILHPEKYVSDDAVSQYRKSKEPEPVKKYRYKITSSAEGFTEGTIDLTADEAAIVAYAINKLNWRITEYEPYCGNCNIDINHPTEILNANTDTEIRKAINIEWLNSDPKEDLTVLPKEIIIPENIGDDNDVIADFIEGIVSSVFTQGYYEVTGFEIVKVMEEI